MNGRSEYLEILESAWQDHLKPREPGAPTVVSLFAGCGGSSLGYSMAGYWELLAVEWDDNAVATFRLNFPDVPVYHGDIHGLSVDECLRLTGLEPGQLDVLDGSPPCQGFSTAGKRRMDDRRNQLYHEYVRLLRGLRPKVLVMENVSGLVKGKMKLIFADIMRELKASGYVVSCRLMNAMYFNVPQSRQRLIWIGVREDLGIRLGYLKAESRLFTLRDAIGSLDTQVELESSIERFAIGKEWERLSQGEKSKKYLSLIKPLWDKPSPTITKVAGETISAASVTHPSKCRKYSITEAKVIQSFPLLFRFIGGYQIALMLIGNSVPPLFMRSIANHIYYKVLGRVTTGFIPHLTKQA